MVPGGGDPPNPDPNPNPNPNPNPDPDPDPDPNPKSFSWFQAEDILSVNQDAARAFYKSVANLLVVEKEADYDMSQVEKETVLIDDPFRVVTALWEEAPGLKDDSDPRAWSNWRQRVARFLYWAVDGGLHPGEMTLDMLIKCERRQSGSLRARDILQRLFDFFIRTPHSARTPA